MREKKIFLETFSRQTTRAIEMISFMSDTFMRRKVNETNSHKLLDYSADDKMLHDDADNHRWLTFAYVHLLVTEWDLCCKFFEKLTTKTIKSNKVIGNETCSSYQLIPVFNFSHVQVIKNKSLKNVQMQWKFIGFLFTVEILLFFKMILATPLIFLSTWLPRQKDILHLATIVDMSCAPVVLIACPYALY